MKHELVLRRCLHCDKTHTIYEHLIFQCDCGKEIIPLYYSISTDEEPALVGLTVDWQNESEAF